MKDVEKLKASIQHYTSEEVDKIKYFRYKVIIIIIISRCKVVAMIMMAH